MILEIELWGAVLTGILLFVVGLLVGLFWGGMANVADEDKD